MRFALALFFFLVVAPVSAAAVRLPSNQATAIQRTVSSVVGNAGKAASVLQLLEEYQTNSAAIITADGGSIVHFLTALENEHTELLEALVADDMNVDINHRDDRGLTPLHNAVINNNQASIDILLAKRARADLRDATGKTPVDHAKDSGSEKLAETLELYAQAMEQVEAEQERSLLGAAPATPDAEVEEEVPSFLINLNKLAEDGKIDPVIGRIKEINEVIRIASRRQKNNPILVGEAGVGKTAIVEGIADMIVKDTVHESFRGKTIYAIDVAALMAGTGGQGDLEARILELLEFARLNPDALFFFDEAHVMIGAGAGGGINIANLLKPALARGDLRCIAATTDNEYRQHIMTDDALTRRFGRVNVYEPTLEEALEVALSARNLIAEHHGVEISDLAVLASVVLPKRYMQDRRLPDVSIDLLDEATALVKLAPETRPLELRNLKQKIKAKEVFMHLEGGNIENEIAELKKELAEKEKDDGELSPTVERLHIAEIISQKTSVPVEKILMDSQNKILELLPWLKKRVFGQDHVLEEVNNVLMIAYSGIGDPTKPLGSFLFRGPTGTGKTETAKQMAEFLFDGELVVFDMSEYSESHSVARLIGSPPGYVGYEEGGSLVNAILNKSHAIILLDEIEKAHPVLATLMLQILDEGRLTDGRNTVSLKDTIIVMTTNADRIEDYFPKEFIGRIQKTLTFNKLDKKIMADLVKHRLTLLNERLRNKRITVSLSPKTVEKLSDEGYSEEYGARPLQGIFRDRIELPLAKEIVSGNIKQGSYSLILNDDGSIRLTKKRARKTSKAKK